jgi:hypothetical protein
MDNSYLDHFLSPSSSFFSFFHLILDQILFSEAHFTQGVKAGWIFAPSKWCKNGMTIFNPRHVKFGLTYSNLSLPWVGDNGQKEPRNILVPM